jgi:hypothetical protein
MKEYQSLSHTRRDCKYHVVFLPKRRKQRVCGVLRRHLDGVFHELASHKESRIVEGHMMGGHGFMGAFEALTISSQRFCRRYPTTYFGADDTLI